MHASPAHVETRLRDERKVPDFVRTQSEVRSTFARAGAATRLIDHYESGGLRLRVPNAPHGLDAILINTAGGLAGGDHVGFSCDIGPAARLRLSTQSAEKVYRAELAPAVISVRLSAGKSARLAWLPQETIVFDGAALQRSLDVEIDPTATATLFEMTVLGRRASGERLTTGTVRDSWRIRRGGRLVFADNVRIDGDVTATLSSAATARGIAAFATLVHLAPGADKRLRNVRAALSGAASECGISAWNGMLVARFAAAEPGDLRRDAARLIQRLSGTETPRFWAF